MGMKETTVKILKMITCEEEEKHEETSGKPNRDSKESENECKNKQTKGHQISLSVSLGFLIQ